MLFGASTYVPRLALFVSAVFLSVLLILRFLPFHPAFMPGLAITFMLFALLDTVALAAWYVSDPVVRQKMMLQKELLVHRSMMQLSSEIGGGGKDSTGDQRQLVGLSSEVDAYSDVTFQRYLLSVLFGQRFRGSALRVFFPSIDVQLHACDQAIESLAPTLGQHLRDSASPIRQRYFRAIEMHREAIELVNRARSAEDFNHAGVCLDRALDELRATFSATREDRAHTLSE